VPISGIVLTVVGIVLLVTHQPIIGAICLVVGLGLIGYAMTQRGKGSATG
jgi:hypothetical protein